MYRQAPSPGLVVAAFGRNVVALERRSGRVAWRWAGDASTNAFDRIAFGDGCVVASSAVGPTLVCLAYTTGALLWRATSSIFGPTLVVDGDQILVGGAGEVACLELATGRVQWREPFKGLGVGAVALGVPGNVALPDRR